MKGFKHLIVVVLATALLGSGALAQRREGRGRDDRSNPPRAGDWLMKNKNLAPQDREKALENDPNFKNLPPDRQQRLRKRLEWFNTLPPERQQHVLNNMNAWNSLTPEQQARAKDLFGRYRQLPMERKRVMRQAFTMLRGLDPVQRQAAIESPRFKSTFSDSERDLLRGMTELSIGPAHEEDEYAGEQ